MLPPWSSCTQSAANKRPHIISSTCETCMTLIHKSLNIFYFATTPPSPSRFNPQPKKMGLKDSVVLFPTVGMGHLIPMVELAKLFDAHGFSVTVVVVDPPFDTSSTIDPFLPRVASANPSIHFHRLPKIPSSKDTTSYHFDTLRKASAQLLDFLRTRRPALNVRALVLDMFCMPGLDVAEELGVPKYFFYPSGAVALAAFLALPTLQSEMEGGSFRDLGDAAKVDLPGLPPISVVDLPDDIPDRTDINTELLSNLEHLWRADGFIINTFEWLEKRAVRALKDGSCVPGRRNPPVYCIGPLNINEGEKGGSGGGGGETTRHECLEWLDAQPERSVVFLCFGSNGFLPAEQLREIAVGLERSGQRFLWVARARPNAKGTEEATFLPEGFLERTRGRGMVVRSWVPQGLVLAHGSVGAFVSHCGWNSSLEAVSAGLPVVAWPRGAEQRMNKVLLVEEAKVAVAVEGYEKGMVGAEEVERRIRWVMESEEMKAVRDHAAEAKEEAAAARKGEGSSTLAWAEVVKSLRKS